MATVEVNVIYETHPGGYVLPAFATDGVLFTPATAGPLLTATVEDGGRPSREVKVDIERLLFDVSTDFIFEHGRVVRFTVNDVRTWRDQPGGPRVICIGLEERVTFSQDTSTGVPVTTRVVDQRMLRDRIIRSCIAKSDDALFRVLSLDGVLIRAVEYFIDAICDRDHQMAELYNVIELVKNRLGGGDHGFTKIGLSKAHVDYVKMRANRPEHDERHPPHDVSAVVPLSQAERDESIARTREVIRRYAEAVRSSSLPP